MCTSEFTEVSRPYGNCFQHNTHKAFWVVHRALEEALGKPSYFLYTATDSFDGRDPWTVNNRRVGTYLTLADARAAIPA